MKVFQSVTLATITAIAAMAGPALADSDQNRSQTRDNSPADFRVIQGLRISPVPVNARGKDRALVGLGSYLVNAVGGCNDCHTHPSYLPGGDPFQGQTAIVNSEQYLTGGRQFGPITSPNITPNADGLPAGFTFEQFSNLLRTGHDPDEPSRIFQIMPWPVYSNMTDLDIRALYEYLRAIPSRPDNPTPGT